MQWVAVLILHIWLSLLLLNSLNSWDLCRITHWARYKCYCCLDSTLRRPFCALPYLTYFNTKLSKRYAFHFIVFGRLFDISRIVPVVWGRLVIFHFCNHQQVGLVHRSSRLLNPQLKYEIFDSVSFLKFLLMIFFTLLQLFDCQAETLYFLFKC